MSIINKSNIPERSPSPSRTVIKNNNDNFQERIAFLQQRQINTRYHQQPYNSLKKPKINSANISSTSSIINNRTPVNLLELKQQRLIEAADRKKRIITRIISIVGVLIILLCAGIVTLTLKMSPKIDELVRTRSGQQNLFYHMSRVSTPLTTTTITTITSNNLTINSTSIFKSPFRSRQRSFI
ncbi:unnamed protein product [Rotaria sordida]|uniref:Uncharacterized protein n=1 Tax=Rotaria sordida TaxID=392033 RepID=A0A814WEU0_9BILA|nr:unnamed protein product [Rotaria sordida]CAF1200465.1 unnamed protein product [Rotaria sordida]CAF3542326.1 unnamed protein product [Rotaria sordida]CAF3628552.1 unnamed protein product [Rotaria sordida]